jgi:pyruvate ferredoxin oxidoreductase beta subunit
MNLVKKQSSLSISDLEAAMTTRRKKMAENTYNFKEVCSKPERLAPGHRMCAGCGGTIAVRTVLRALHEGDKAVIGNATGCLEVSTFMYPYTAYEDSYIHNAFENAGSTMSGVETAYNVLKRKGKINDTYKFITFGGDGGTYDIGLQSLSGAMERNHDMVYVCYDNGAYMNTGIQRSSATPMFADTTTTPVGSQSNGKMQNRKDLASIIADHDVPYVAQSTLLGNFKDLYTKSEKAIYTPGAAFLNVMAPCPRGWRYPTEDIMEICKLGVETCYWPLFEVDHGKWILNYEPKKKLPIEDFLRPQGRFKHLFKKGNEDLIAQFQAEVDRRWEDLLYKCNR